MISLRNAFGFKAVNSFNGKSMKEFDEGAAARRVPLDDPPAETRECEGCGERKPIEEMATVFLPGTGETYQCSDCRGGP